MCLVKATRAMEDIKCKWLLFGRCLNVWHHKEKPTQVNRKIWKQIKSRCST